MGVCMRNNRRNEQSSAPTTPKQPRNDDPEGLGSFGKGLLDLLTLSDFLWSKLVGGGGRGWGSGSGRGGWGGMGEGVGVGACLIIL